MNFKGERLQKTYLCFSKTSSYYSTVWKFEGFSVAQILREIKVVGFRNSKTAILTLLETLNLDFVNLLIFH